MRRRYQMETIQYNFWIGNQEYNQVGFLPADECDFNRDNFKSKLEKELGKKIKLLTDVHEKYFRTIKDCRLIEWYGIPCKKGKGATLYYYAGYESEE